MPRCDRPHMQTIRAALRDRPGGRELIEVVAQFD